MTETVAAPAALTERRGNVMVITINRPEARNAINAAVSIALGLVHSRLDFGRHADSV